MSRYAQNTDVPSDRSRAEIEKTLSRYGASSFMYGWQSGAALVAFEMSGRRIKFHLPLPDKDQFGKTDTGRERASNQIEKAYEQAVKQRWRALALVIKAKLEAVETGITQFEEEFMAHIVLPNGSTVGEFMVPQIASAYESGRMPPMLPAPTEH